LSRLKSEANIVSAREFAHRVASDVVARSFVVASGVREAEQY